jgi:Ca2+-binding RTX toxin-like protein
VLHGVTGDDQLLGGGGADLLNGGAGNDVLYGEGGVDTLNGDAGDDVLYGGSSSDTLNGGTGQDTLYGGGSGDVLNGGDGDDQLLGGGSTDLLNGGTGNDVLYGEGGVDTLNGDAGDDVLYGGSSADTLYGGTGRDTLYGGGSGDVLNGGSGRDIIDGGNGNDIMTGGAGDDTYIFDDTFGADIITDFADNADVLDFTTHSVFNSLADVLAVATQVGADVLINLSANNRLTLQNFTLADLDASDFEFSGGAANEGVEEIGKAVISEDVLDVMADVGKPIISDDDSFVFVEKAVVSDDGIGFDGFAFPEGQLQALWADYLAQFQFDTHFDTYIGVHGFLEIAPDADFTDFGLYLT